MILCMPAPRTQGVARVARRMNVEGGWRRANDRTVPTNLTPIAHRMSLVSRAHHTPRRCVQPVSLFYPVFLKPPSPVLRERAFLKPPPVTMPGSLFPRSPSMVPGFASALQTPRIQRVSNNAPSPTPNAIGVKVHPILEDHHAEADVSSGAPFRRLRCVLFLTLAHRGRYSIPTQTLCQGEGETEGCRATIRS
jgi:hypothetical protein